MNTLLMAVARGARVQQNDQYDGLGEWADVRYGVATDVLWQRIHPDDDHFRFGPISTALREWAMGDRTPYPITTSESMARIFLLESLSDTFILLDDGHRRLHLLILSEALAEEGL